MFYAADDFIKKDFNINLNPPPVQPVCAFILKSIQVPHTSGVSYYK